MRDLKTILEGILDKDFDMDIPKEIEEFVKICNPLKFTVDNEYPDKSVYKCTINGKIAMSNAITKMINLFNDSEQVSLNDYIYDDSVTLVGVVGGNARGGGNIVVAIPKTSNMVSMYCNKAHLFLYDFSNESVRSVWSFDTRPYKWYKFPIESFSMIRAALMK